MVIVHSYVKLPEGSHAAMSHVGTVFPVVSLLQSGRSWCCKSVEMDVAGSSDIIHRTFTQLASFIICTLW